jgi:hypothetical protein
MKLTGTYKLNAKKEVVWEALNNTEILKLCIPGCESLTKKSDSVFNVIATNQIGPMNATFNGTLSLTNIKKNESYTLSGEGQAPVGFVNGSADVKLLEENKITILAYIVNINVGGKIAQLGSRLIDGIAKKMADYFFGRFADFVDPIKKDDESKVYSEHKRVKELKSNFLNKYIYLIITPTILLLVAIIYFVSR